MRVQREWYGRNKLKRRKEINNRKAMLKEWFIDKKKLLKCERCSESDYICLDFHHIGDKENDVSRMVSNGCSIKNIENEINKCIVLCSNCHRKEHRI